MDLLSYWDGWFPLWPGGLWLLPFMVVLCIVGMFFCSRMCCGGAWTPWGRGNQTRGGGTPLDIAKRRYARGEITKEQCEDIKRTLG